MKKFSALGFIALSWLILWASPAAWGSAFDTNVNSARFIGGGRAGIAAQGRNIEDVMHLNPALIATKADLNFFTSYAFGDNGVAPDQRQIAVGLIDSTSGSWDPKGREFIREMSPFPLASGVSYTNIKNDFYRDQYLTLNIAQAMSGRLAIGLSGNYSFLKSQTSSLAKDYFDLGFGLIYRFNTRLSLGVSGLNLLDSRKDFDLAHLRRSIGLGGQFQIIKTFFMRLDAWNSKSAEDKNRWNYRLGFENIVTPNFHLRFGWGKDDILDTNVLGLGFSLVGPRLTLHYGFQRETSTDNVLHSVDLQLPLW